MLNICARMLGHTANVQDVLQESFLLGFQNLHQLKDPLKFSGWLKRIVINQCLRHSRVQPVAIDLNADWQTLGAEDADHWFQSVSFEELEKAIEALPDGYRQVFTLYAVESYSHKEIATLLKISESTSKSQYHRARQLLKKTLLKRFVF